MIAFSYQNGTTPIKRTGKNPREDDEYHKVAAREEAMQMSNDSQYLPVTQLNALNWSEVLLESE